MSIETTTRELTIHPRLQSLWSPLEKDVLEGLEADILRHGCVVPIEVWGDIIVDGHWRYAICKKHNLPFTVRNQEFESIEDALLWAFKAQCSRRNLCENDDEEARVPIVFTEDEFVVLELDPSLIRTDLGTQVRLALDKEAIDDYASAMRRGDDFPPILIFYDEESDLYILVDGFHRFFAHQRAKPGEPIVVKRRLGNLEAARWAAIGANKKNSVRRTNEDKKRAVEWALLHACGARMSNRQIADHVGVDEITVRRNRARLESTATLSQSAERVGRDGRTINTSKIGKREPSVTVHGESAMENSLKNLLNDFDPDNAEGFIAKAIEICRCHDKLDRETSEKLLRQLENGVVAE